MCILLAQFAESLWVGLNLQRSWAESPVPPLPPMPTSLPQTTGSTLSSGGVVAIVVPCATVVLLLVMGGVWALRHGWMRRGPSGPPGMGPSSTLVVVGHLIHAHMHTHTQTHAPAHTCMNSSVPRHLREGCKSTDMLRIVLAVMRRPMSKSLPSYGKYLHPCMQPHVHPSL